MESSSAENVSPLGLPEPRPAPEALGLIPVWDVAVRLGHWATVLAFAVAFLTAESERWRLIHIWAGLTLLGVTLFRVLWGVVGTRHARFASFVRSPSRAWAYLRSLVGPHPQHHTGHNPAGAWAVLALLALLLATAGTGLAMEREMAGHWVEAVHEGCANCLLALVGVHVAAVLLSSWRHGENLIRPMLTGFKRGRAAEAPRHRWWGRLGAGVLVAWVVVFFWWARPAQASTPAEQRVCTDAPTHRWIGEARMRERFGTADYLMVQFKVSRTRCYEFYAIARDGSVVEAYYDPTDGRLVKWNRIRGNAQALQVQQGVQAEADSTSTLRRHLDP